MDSLKEWLKQNSRLYRALRERHQRLKRRLWESRSNAHKFSKIHRKRRWGDPESTSGAGSRLDQTQALRAQLSALIRGFEITSLLDVPCGDFNWMKEVDLHGVKYIGADIVPALIEDNSRRYARENVAFRVLNLASDHLPRCDLVFVRDCLVHLSNHDAMRCIANIKASGSRYLLATTFPEVGENVDTIAPNWRATNLEKPPFDFPPPRASLDEGTRTPLGNKSARKMMGLWVIEDLSDGAPARGSL